MHRVLDWLSGRPYLLLTLTMLMWGGNAVAGRLAVGEVSAYGPHGLALGGAGRSPRCSPPIPASYAPASPPGAVALDPADGYARPHGVQRPVLPRGPPHDGGQPHHPTGIDAGLRAGRSLLVLRHAHPRMADRRDSCDPARRSPRRDAGGSRHAGELLFQ